MDANTWQDAKEWLVEAAALPESERATYLAQRCPDDAVRGELLEMLASNAALSGIVGASTLKPGTRLGPYEIGNVIGAGGMGEVYRARDVRLDRDVAIKVILPPFAADRDRLARFGREAKLLGSLNHPHICTLFDVGRDAGTDYIVMEYVDGELLSHRLRQGPLPVDQALRYASEIADALDKAHGVGIVHRDLKPGNVMLTKLGTKLLDFGLARNTRTPSIDVTKTGTILGTLRYMAPEQLKGAEADARSDVWAFGCVLYQMLAGRQPFDGVPEAAVGAAILETEPPPLSSLVRGISPPLQRVVDRCLAKAPDDRWQSVADLRHELNWIAKSGGKGDDRAPARAAKSSRDWIAWVAAAAAVAVAIGAMAIGIWRTRHLSQPAMMRVSITLPNGVDQARFLALSNDGQLAFVGRPRDGGAALIWVQTIGEVDARPLTGTAGSPIFPFWSPGGRELGFFADGKMKAVDVASGAIRDICPAPNGRGGTWAGHTILFVPDQRLGVHRVSDQGGVPTPVTRNQPMEIHRFPRFLADGVHFLFTSELDNVVSFNVGSVDGGITELGRVTGGNRPSETALTQVYSVQGMLVFARGGLVLAQALDETRWRLSGEPIVVVPQNIASDLSSAAFAVSDSALVYRPAPPRPTAQLTWLPRSGGPGTPLWTPEVFGMVQLSDDDRRTIVARSDGSKLVFWTFPVAHPASLQSLGEGSGSPIVWSHDDTRVLFRKSGMTFHNNIYSVLADGGGDERLEVDQPDGNKNPLGWSDTGSLLYAVNAAGTRYDLWEKPSSGAARILVSSAARASTNFADAAVTGAGDLIASVAENVLYVQPIRRESARVRVDAGSKIARPKWRADGHELYYLDGAHVMAVDVGGANPPVVGNPHPLIEFAGDAYAPTHDGQRFLAAVPQTSSVPNGIGVVLNWARLVGK
jgi:eukaryotic-like serine/threonine-protein kinase